MARIRAVEIDNFRGIKHLSWRPGNGTNCLIGNGDSGKSTILDAIDYCLGARRTIQFADTDFYGLDVTNTICVRVTVGALDDNLKSIDTYGAFLRGFDPDGSAIDDEPGVDRETVLTVSLTVESDLEGVWQLFSERAIADDVRRSLSWEDRRKLAPARIEASGAYNLAWRRGSVLNRISDERVDTNTSLANAGREARRVFGESASQQLPKALAIVDETAADLGVPVGGASKAMLDAATISLVGGSLCLHDDGGIPLRSLGTGSSRLLVAGLQRKAAEQAAINLIDEVEHGLEPHRIARLLQSLGCSDGTSPLQVFMTTHSPIAVRELQTDQLFVVRPGPKEHIVRAVASSGDVQGTVRAYPEAFLSLSVIVCEGASEVGLIRGLDRFNTTQKGRSIYSYGVAVVDAKGVKQLYQRAMAFHRLGYRTLVLRDDDEQPDEDAEREFLKGGGELVKWRPGRALEDELFLSLDDAAVGRLVGRAVANYDDALVDQHIRSASANKMNLADLPLRVPDNWRQLLGRAAKSKHAGWFKSVGKMDLIAFDIVGPSLQAADEGFAGLVKRVFSWARSGQ